MPGRYLGLPDLPYFTGDPVFQPGSPASRKEAARETESPVFDYKLIDIGRFYKLCDSNLHHFYFIFFYFLRMF